MITGKSRKSEFTEFVRILAPVAYLLVCMTVLVLTIMVVDAVERHWILHTWFRKGDIDAGLAMMLLGAVLLPLTTVALSSLEGPRSLAGSSHLRQSAGVYVLALAAAAYMSGNPELRDGLGYAVAAGACVLGIYAALINWAVLRVIGYRRDKPGGNPVISRSAPSLSP